MTQTHRHKKTAARSETNPGSIAGSLFLQRLAACSAVRSGSPVSGSELLLDPFRTHATSSPGPITKAMFEIDGPISDVVPEPPAMALGFGLLAMSFGVLGRRGRKG